MLLDQPNDLLPQLVIFLNVRRIDVTIQCDSPLGIVTTVTGDTVLGQERLDVLQKMRRGSFCPARPIDGGNDKQTEREPKSQRHGWHILDHLVNVIPAQKGFSFDAILWRSKTPVASLRLNILLEVLRTESLPKNVQVYVANAPG